MNLLRRIRAVLGVGVTWALAWAIAGAVIGVSSLLLPALPWNAFFEVFDAPLPALAIPGFVAGVIYATLLGVVGRHRRFDQLSLRWVAAWGAVGGVLLSGIPLLLSGAGLGVWWVLVGPFTMLSAASASASLVIARRAEESAGLPAGR